MTSYAKLTTEYSPNSTQPPTWQLVASGYWYEGTYPSGHIAYFLAKTGAQEWTMESVERNALLDGLTQEDVDEGRLNDHQIQSMWGITAGGAGLATPTSASYT